MNIAKWFANDTWQLNRNEWAVVVTAAASIGLATTTAWATPIATLVIMVVPALLVALGQKRLPGLALPIWLIPIFVFVAYAALSSLWGAGTYWSARALLPVAGIMLAASIAASLFERLPGNLLTHLCRTIVVTFFVIACYSLFEETTNHALKHVLFWPFQAVKFTDGSLLIDWDHQTRVRPSRTNWNMTVLLFLIWPVLLMLRGLVERFDYKLLGSILLIGLFAIILQSYHVAAMVALIACVAAFGLTHIWPRVAIILVGMAWIFLFILPVPSAHQLHAHQLHLDQQVPNSFRHRIVLWKYTATEIEKRPVLGVGVGSTHPLNERRLATAKLHPGTSYHDATGTHPHNIYLQAIYELGVVGAVLMLLAGLSVLRAIHVYCSRVERPFFLALFAAWASQSSFSFGLTEPWYLFALGLAMCCLMAARQLRSS